MHKYKSVVMVLSLAATSHVSAQMIGSDAFSTAIGSIDTRDATWSTIGNAGPVINGMAYNPNDDVFYGISAGSSNVYTIDADTGRASVIGRGGGIAYGNANGLAYDPIRNILFGSDNNTHELFTINTTTGESARVAGFNNRFTEIEGLAFDSDNDTLYGLAPLQRAIVSIDPRTADTQFVASIPDGVWRGLTWNSDTGSLFLSAVNIFNDADIFEYSISNDSLSFVGNTRGIEAVQGLAYKSIPAPASVAVLGFAALGSNRRKRA
ncbi:MAG: hypothetical protein ED559_11485 [Phycisphaera sp.]|nr:MAG: hypothetical protein ED559_11485 [Phycisphaera sp.]